MTHHPAENHNHPSSVILLKTSYLKSLTTLVWLYSGDITDPYDMTKYIPYLLLLKGNRICHLQVFHFSIRIILSRRQLKRNKCNKSSLPSSSLPKSRVHIYKGVLSLISPLYRKNRVNHWRQL